MYYYYYLIDGTFDDEFPEVMKSDGEIFLNDVLVILKHSLQI